MKKSLVFLFVVMFVFWAALIFYFSSQPYQDQDLTPYIDKLVDNKVLSERLSGISFHYDKNEVSIEALGAAGFIEFFIRKGAHFFIFFILGFLTIMVLRKFSRKKILPFICSTIFVFLYACLDELHQKYTGNRTPLFKDVILDTTGGITGILFYSFIIYMSSRKIRS